MPRGGTCRRDREVQDGRVAHCTLDLRAPCLVTEQGGERVGDRTDRGLAITLEDDVGALIGRGVDDVRVRRT